MRKCIVNISTWLQNQDKIISFCRKNTNKRNFLVSVKSSPACLYDTIRTGYKANKFFFMSHGISFRSWCKRISNLTKLVCFPSYCPKRRQIGSKCDKPDNRIDPRREVFDGGSLVTLFLRVAELCPIEKWFPRSPAMNDNKNGWKMSRTYHWAVHRVIDQY